MSLTCVKFTFANKIEAMFERSHVNVKFEPRSTLKKKKKAQHFISCLYFIYEIKICVLVHARKDYATVEIYPKRHQNQNVIPNQNVLNKNVSKTRRVRYSEFISLCIVCF